MTLDDLRFDSSRWCMVSIHGKEYPIKKKKDKGCYYIQHSTGQLTVTKLVINQMEPGTIADYVFNGWFLIYEIETYLSFIRAEMAWVN